MQSRSSIAIGIMCAACATVGCHRGPVTPSSTPSSQAASSTVQAVKIGSAATKALTPGGSLQLAAMAQRLDGTEEDVTALARWSSDNDAVASVSASGLVSAAGPGTAQIHADYQGKTGDTAIEVSAPPPSVAESSPAPSPTNPSPNPSPTVPAPSPSPTPAPTPSPAPAPSPSQPGPPPATVQSVTISGGSNVPIGRSLQLRATSHLSDGTDRDVTSSAEWSTSNSTGASVSQSGVLTGLLVGSNVVTARYNGATATQPVQVTPF